MDAEFKSAIFALILVVTNWHWARSTQGTNTSWSINVEAAGFGVLFCAVAIFVLARRLYRVVRKLLDSGIRVRRDMKLFSWRPMLMLLPFGLTLSATPIITTTGSTTTTVTYGYESNLSGVLVVLAILLIVVYQAYSKLEEYQPAV